MFTLRQVQMFEAVARTGGYSKAAEELGVSQPSVSVQVQELEKELGVELFARGGRRTQLTEVGASFYSKAVRILAAVEESVVVVDAYLGLERGRLRIGAIESAGLYLLPAVMSAYSAEHPGIEVELTIETAAEIASGLSSGRLDVGFGDVDFDADSQIESRRVLTTDFVVVTGRQHPLSLQQKADSASLKDESFIVEAEGSPSFRGLEWLASGMEGAAPTVAMQVTTCDALKQMVRAHLGIAVTYRFCVDWEHTASQIHILDVTDLGGEQALFAYTAKGMSLSPAADNFLGKALEMLPARSRQARR